MTPRRGRDLGKIAIGVVFIVCALFAAWFFAEMIALITTGDAIRV